MAFNQFGGYPNTYQQQYNPYQQRSNLEWIMVPTVADVEKVSVQPGQKAWVMVQNDAVFALRTADQMGLIQTDMYTFEKYSPKPAAPAADYVTKAEFEQAISALSARFGGGMNESTRQQDRTEYGKQQPYGNPAGPENAESGRCSQNPVQY